MDIKQLTINYFNAWNNHDLDKLKDLFSDSCSLREWDINVSRKEKVIEANSNIFNLLPYIRANIINIYIDNNSKTTVSELIIELNENDKLKVIDVIAFNSNGSIETIRAYKG
jgi:hypothetical protein